VHHPKQQTNRDDVKWKAEQEKQRRDQAIANTTGIRVLKAIGDAVPVRLMKRDLLFVLMQTFPLLNEWHLQTLARQHGIRKDRETDMLDKLFTAFLRRADEGTLMRLLVEVTVVLAIGRSNGTNALREAAMVYKVDTDATALKVKQEFAAKAKGKKRRHARRFGYRQKSQGIIDFLGSRAAPQNFVCIADSAPGGRTTFPLPSGKEAALLPLPPLRTGRDSFPSSGSSRW
jgi:hypothetical protein